jgi:hypothetical protein
MFNGLPVPFKTTLVQHNGSVLIQAEGFTNSTDKLICEQQEEATMSIIFPGCSRRVGDLLPTRKYSLKS